MFCADRYSSAHRMTKQFMREQVFMISAIASMCIWIKQPENAAVFRHAAVQGAGFLYGHGKLNEGSDAKQSLLLLRILMICLLLDSSLHVSQPGGYSKPSFDMIVDLCLKYAKQRNVITEPVAEINASHESWCHEFSPLLTRYCMVYLEL